MTTQEKISVLENALTLIDYKHPFRMGICRAIHESLNGKDAYDGGDWDHEAMEWLGTCDIVLPPSVHAFVWSLNPEGDEQRREFLRQHIERLKKTL